MAEALLRARGLRVARYTSLHLVDFRERMIVDGVPIEADAIVDYVNERTPLVEKIGASFFEATTALAFLHFARVGCDVALVEAGLGGRLDSTNVVVPRAAGVTSIGYDHMEYLGPTLYDIAGEKAGIFKPGVPAVIGEPDEELRAFLAEMARAAGASPVHVAPSELKIADVNVLPEGTRFTSSPLDKKHTVQTPLVGRHQAWNFAFTLALLGAAGDPFRVSLSDAVESVKHVRLPGRFQRQGKYLFDVAHNADGGRALVGSLRAVAATRPLVAVLCALTGHGCRGMMDALSEGGG